MTAKYTGTFLLVVGIALRLLCALWPEGYGSDELTSVFFARHESFHALLWDSSPPIYLTSLKFWLMLVPNTEAGARLLSALYSSMTLIIARRMLRDNWLLALLALNPLSVSLAGEVKNAALFELSAVWNFAEFRHVARGDNRLTRYFFSLLAMCCVHYLGAVAAISQFVILFFRESSTVSERVRLRWFLLIGLSVVALTSLAAWLVIRPGSISWMVAFHSEQRSLLFTEPLRVLGSYSWTLVVVSILFLLAGARPKLSLESRYFLIALGITLVVSFLTDHSLGFRRFLVAVNVAYLAALAVAIPNSLRRPSPKFWARVGLLGLCCGLWTKKLVEDHLHTHSGWRETRDIQCVVGALAHVRGIVVGPASLAQYFDGRCAQIVQAHDIARVVDDLVASPGVGDFWVAGNSWGVRTISSNPKLKFERTVDSSSMEPIFVYKLRR